MTNADGLWTALVVLTQLKEEGEEGKRRKKGLEFSRLIYLLVSLLFNCSII